MQSADQRKRCLGTGIHLASRAVVLIPNMNTHLLLALTSGSVLELYSCRTLGEVTRALNEARPYGRRKQRIISIGGYENPVYDAL